MARPPDNELRTTVQAVRKNLKGFMAIVDEREQWFTLSTQGDVQCPEKGADIIIKYNISPGNDQYPEPTYWANEVLNPRLVEQNSGTYQQAHEEAAQAVEHQATSATEIAEPKKGEVVGVDTRADLTYDQREALKDMGINRRAALNAAVELWKGVESVPAADLLGQYAANLYNATFTPIHGEHHHVEDGPEPAQQEGPEPPAPQRNEGWNES